MRVQRLDIENFRGIRGMQIDFHPKLNVLVGKNGAGKTTILNSLGKAIDIALLNHVTANEKRELESRTIITPHDIRFGEIHARIRLQFSLKGRQVSTTVSSNPEEMASDLISHFSGVGVQLPHKTFSEQRPTLTGTYMPNEQIINAILGADPAMGLILKHVTQFAPFPLTEI